MRHGKKHSIALNSTGVLIIYVYIFTEIVLQPRSHVNIFFKNHLVNNIIIKILVE